MHRSIQTTSLYSDFAAAENQLQPKEVSLFFNIPTVIHCQITFSGLKCLMPLKCHGYAMHVLRQLLNAASYDRTAG
jgi:hypothetical protein